MYVLKMCKSHKITELIYSLNDSEIIFGKFDL